MKMRKGFLWVLSFLFYLFVAVTWAGAETQQPLLIMLSEKYNQRYLEEKSEALEFAKQFNLVVRKVFEDGRVIELMRIQDGVPVYYTTHNLEGAGLINSDKVWPGGSALLNLTGSGQALGIWDGGKVRVSHNEFGARATQQDGATELDNHATHVAGTMIASGAVSIARGMSYEAFLHAYDWENDNTEMAAAASQGLRVSNHSYGLVTGWAWNIPVQGSWGWFGDVNVSEIEDYRFGFYTNKARQWDEIAFNAPYYLIAKSAGNDRNDAHTGSHYYWKPGQGWTLSTAYREPDGGSDGYDSISSNGNAKNILTVGAVDKNRNMSAFSGWGPTDDGRIKPDIVAKGVDVYSSLAGSNSQYATYSGTSMSSPMVSGSIGLLMQHQENLHGSDNPLLSSTLKALIIHGADDSISGAPGPDYRFGWGLMDTQRSAKIMSLNADAGGNAHIRELKLMENSVISIPVIADGTEPLRATIVWNDKPGVPPSPSLNPTNLMLINDLDLIILDEQNNLARPYVLNPSNPLSPASTGDNFRDNVEMVHINNPNGGAIYTIQVSHKKSLDGNSQNFSLIVTGGSMIDEGLVADPESLKVTLQLGQKTSLPLTITNNSNSTVGFEILKRHVNQPNQVNVKPFREQVAESTEPVSIGRAFEPRFSKPVPETQDIVQTSGTPAYAMDLLDRNLVRIPDVDKPNTWNVISNKPNSFYYAGDFINGDFSTLYVLDSQLNELHALNTATGAHQVVGPSIPRSGELWTGITGGLNGVMYASSTNLSRSTLYTLDIKTGQVTEVGQITNAPAIIDIAISSDFNIYGVDIVNNVLVRIDHSTGAGSVIGLLGFDPNFAQSMDFDEESGILYWAAYSGGRDGQLRIIDTVTGASEIVGPFPNGAEVGALAFATGGVKDIPWLDVDPVAGTIAGKGSQSVEVTFDAGKKKISKPGVYHARLDIRNNSSSGLISVPVTLTVVPSGITPSGITPGVLILLLDE